MIVYDSSAIYKIISIGKSSQLSVQHTSSLAFFELGNIVWKNSVLKSIYSQSEAIELLEACERVLEKMRISYADIKDIYHIAGKCHISFYDASYVCLARELKCPFVTLDNKLASKIKSVVDTLALEEIM